MKKHMKKTEQTKQNLIDAFIALYSERRIEHITVKDITNLAGYNRGTFYVYFKDVYDVLEQVEAFVLDKMSSALGTIVIESGVLSIDSFFQAISGIYQENERMVTALLSNPNSNFVISYKKVIKNFYTTQVQSVLGDMSIMIDYAVEYQISAIIGLINRWIALGRQTPVDEMLGFLRAISTQGVATVILRHMQAKLETDEPFICLTLRE